MQPMVLEQLEMHRQKSELPDNTHTVTHTKWIRDPHVRANYKTSRKHGTKSLHRGLVKSKISEIMKSMNFKRKQSIN